MVIFMSLEQARAAAEQLAEYLETVDGTRVSIEEGHRIELIDRACATMLEAMKIELGVTP